VRSCPGDLLAHSRSALERDRDRKHRRNLNTWLAKIESFTVCKGCGQKNLPHILCPFCFPFNRYLRSKEVPNPPKTTRP
jgi:ribosomal protein L32